MTPQEIVTTFLTALEDRDIAGANALLGEGFAMLFPGGRRYLRVEDFVAGAATRYSWVKKRHERIDAVADGRDTIVYVYGTLYGAWLDGSTFEGIRYIDRFVVRDGRLVDQLVWNDLAETLAQKRAERLSAA